MSATASTSVDRVEGATAKKEDPNQTEMQDISTDESTSTVGTKGCSRNPVVDIAQTLSLQVGDRVEVQWDIICDNVSTIRWWGATLLEFDGRTKEGVAIRTIEYDPFPEGGFDESSKEDVIFIGRDQLITFPSEETLDYRLEAAVWIDDDKIEEMIDGILGGTMQKLSSRFNALSPAQQSFVAEKVARQKGQLLELIHEHIAANKTRGVNRPISAEDITSLFAQIAN
jgi:hypothetical protein